MITLITGGPGTGKTAWLLSQLVELRKVDPNREFFIHGVRNLRGLPHEQIFCRSQLCDICRAQDAEILARSKMDNAPKYVEEWPEWKTTGALIIVDEVQRIWRPRSSGAQMPVGVSGLETHRHYGLDLWLISQGPHLFDNAIRLLVGRHVHLVARWSGRNQYEWPECKQDVQSRSDAVERPYKLPKHVYSMYDSAEVHTKQNMRKPISFYASLVALCLAVVMVGFAVYRIKHRVYSEDKVASEAVATASAGGAVSKDTFDSSSVASFPDFTPKISGVLESAPAYVELVKVTAVPIMMGCVLNKKTDKCSCYTAQATLYPTSQQYCLETIANHRFNPYLVQASNDVKHDLQRDSQQPIKNDSASLPARF